MTEEIKRSVPLSEILELLRLASRIATPEVVYRKDAQLEMATDVVANSIKYAEAIEEILYKWTH